MKNLVISKISDGIRMDYRDAVFPSTVIKEYMKGYFKIAVVSKEFRCIRGVNGIYDSLLKHEEDHQESCTYTKLKIDYFGNRSVQVFTDVFKVPSECFTHIVICNVDEDFCSYEVEQMVSRI